MYIGRELYLKNKLKVSLTNVSKNDIPFLYDLLKERLNYSKELDYLALEDFPSFKKHTKLIEDFIENKSNSLWFAFHIINIEENNKNEKVGSVVIRKDGEWGYHIFQKHWNRKIGQETYRNLIKIYPKKRLWGKVKVENKRAVYLLEKKYNFKLKYFIYENDKLD
jgi:RimJ/RimL family protein N-acetyltransferase